MAFPSLDNERMILRELAIGEEHAFRQLYHHYAGAVYAVSFMHLKKVDLAEDLVQSVFLKIWENRASLGQVQSFAGWLYILTRNTIISTLRKQGSEITYLDYLKQRFELLNAEPEQELLRKEQWQLVRQGIKQLSIQQQTALALQQEEGLSYRQIGERMGISPNTVRVHLFKAMESLRRYVQMHGRDVSLVTMVYLLMEPHACRIV